MRVLRGGGGGERHRDHRSVIHTGDVGGAMEWREIKLKTSCDVPAPLNQRRTTTFDQRAPTFVPTLASFLYQHFKNTGKKIKIAYNRAFWRIFILGT